MVINHIFLRQYVDDPLILRNFHGLGCGDHLLDVGLLDLPVVDRQDTRAVESLNVVPGNADIDRLEVAAGDILGDLHRFSDRGHRALDIDHHPFAHPQRRCGPDPDNIDTILEDLADHAADFCGADIKPDHKIAPNISFLFTDGLDTHFQLLIFVLIHIQTHPDSS